MDMLQLETFVNLVQQGNFSRTAEDMGVSQPTVTIRMKALEDELGLPLILRMGNTLKLTPAGQTFYEHIERSLRVLKEGVEQCTGRRSAETIRLSCAGTPNLCAYVVPKLLGKVYREHPDWEMCLSTARSWEVTEMVLDEVCHIGFINGLFKHPDVVTYALFKDPFYLMAHPSHHLCQREMITLFDLREELLFTYKLESNMSYMIKNLFRDIKMRTDLMMELSDSYTMKRMIMEGNGIGFMPWSAAEQEVAFGRLAVLPLELPVPLMREVNVIALRKNVQLKQVSDFLNLLF
ncbi:LysR family transcriptional regulator [Paenibacillus abyssi]|uniref:HTH-type transcriptional regulator CitR n=1 Tax=Paenibacillus abyssi TaxID=1340531 RepID=A0A917CXH1_9BACL|nr:LysR family transcriptional regulator [Paenibacillus abyssi]GGG00982.1 HTH-type transcriptional regulator CitR [Paenibacillus abyssi]